MLQLSRRRNRNQKKGYKKPPKKHTEQVCGQSARPLLPLIEVNHLRKTMSQCCFDCQNELECLLCQQHFNNRGKECQLILNTDKHEVRQKTGTSEANLNKCLVLLRGSDPNGEEAFIISLRSRRRLMQYPQRLGYSKCFPLRFVLCIFLWNKREK